jgi:hypothetical protein
VIRVTLSGFMRESGHNGHKELLEHIELLGQMVQFGHGWGDSPILSKRSVSSKFILRNLSGFIKVRNLSKYSGNSQESFR